MLDARLGYAFWALRLAVGVDSIVVGLQRFGSEGPLKRGAGVIEVVVGVLVFTPFTQHAAYFLMGWLLLLASKAAGGGGAYDIAVGDVILAAGAFALAQLTRLNEASTPSVALATVTGTVTQCEADALGDGAEDAHPRRRPALPHSSF
jgi:hypothetical protein